MSGSNRPAGSLSEMVLAADTAESPTGKYCPHVFHTPVGSFKFGIENGQVVALYTAKDTPVQFDLTMFGVTRPLKGSGRYALGLADLRKGGDDNIALCFRLTSAAGNYDSSRTAGQVRLKV